jgi:hypothetical protein
LPDRLRHKSNAIAGRCHVERSNEVIDPVLGLRIETADAAEFGEIPCETGGVVILNSLTVPARVR